MRQIFDDNFYVVAGNNFNTAIVDGKFPASTAFVDVSEFTSVVFLIRVGTLTSALTCAVNQDTSATQTASIKVVTGASLVVAADDDNEIKSIEVETAKLDIANGFRYVTLDVTGAGGSDDYLDIMVIGKQPRRAPVTQPAGYSEAVVVAG
jgi:hypothetical protein